MRRPRIGVLGFNPHAGENGLFGDEEARVIIAGDRARAARGIDAYGPLAPDTAFIRPTGKFGFDAAVAMYHDQGLIALKTLEFDRAVNVTLGLPFIRTSPDHGTAYRYRGMRRGERREHDRRDRIRVASGKGVRARGRLRPSGRVRTERERLSAESLVAMVSRY